MSEIEIEEKYFSLRPITQCHVLQCPITIVHLCLYGICAHLRNESYSQAGLADGIAPKRKTAWTFWELVKSTLTSLVQSHQPIQLGCEIQSWGRKRDWGRFSSHPRMLNDPSNYDTRNVLYLLSSVIFTQCIHVYCLRYVSTCLSLSARRKRKVIRNLLSPFLHSLCSFAQNTSSWKLPHPKTLQIWKTKIEVFHRKYFKPNSHSSIACILNPRH